MNGIINVLKPPGMTSQDVVSYVKRTLKEKKVGHTGTLDPNACGVLPICLGKATKIVDYIMNDKKTYICELTLGNETDTCDKYGKKLFEYDMNCEIIDYNTFKSVVESFKGRIKQVPPIFSAVKINGKRAYDLARQGIVPEIKEREVIIYEINILKYTPPTAIIKICCSKGTYIRSLCRDIGRKLGCRAYMSFLIRTATGKFSLENSILLTEITPDDISKKMFRADYALDMKSIFVDKKFYTKLMNGNNISISNSLEFLNNEMVKVYIENDLFIAIGKINNNNLFIEKLLV
ncbi:tRNA pseudouridine synthase B [Caloramator quimbayensis]|uniref:tRNA pseudouridine synthase B n=1 Tax=Caloramator quimbayensis TaxID=1147123 RepID=A0A1T4XBL2_9CLOT|nr:tRNA pseudouridine(55) synthase TruB [Caloramator quimbayensis]SKA86829.1 tRNA pseudouridine synthase B [Caloramator quimbayensis]